VDGRAFRGALDELFGRDRRDTQRFQCRRVTGNGTLDLGLRAHDRPRVFVTRALRVEQILGEHPRPGRNGGRRNAARANERDAVGLPREQRKQLHFERVARGHALHDERPLLALLAEADTLELERRVLGPDLAADIGHSGAQAPRHERGEWILAHRYLSLDTPAAASMARLERASATRFCSRGTWRTWRSGNDARSRPARSA